MTAQVHTHRYCTACGSATETRTISPDEPSRLICTACGKIQYENPVPTAGALIVQDEKLLLVRRAVEPYKGEWDIPGGFLEKHEHPEDALRRELREELAVDVRVRDLVAIVMGTYHGSDESTLNIYYRTDIVSGTLTPRSDIDAAEWFLLTALPAVSFDQNTKVIEMLRRRRAHPQA